MQCRQGFMAANSGTAYYKVLNVNIGSRACIYRRLGRHRELGNYIGPGRVGMHR